MNNVRHDFTGLKTLRRQVRELGAMRVQVGLLRETAGRVSDPGRMSENPALGAIHEFGDPEHNIPERSFIRMPLLTQLGSIVVSRGAALLQVLRSRGARRVLGLLGAFAEDVIQESFATAGWGQWPELTRLTVRRKGSSAILVESAQMRKAVSSRVI